MRRIETRQSSKNVIASKPGPPTRQIINNLDSLKGAEKEEDDDDEIMILSPEDINVKVSKAMNQSIASVTEQNTNSENMIRVRRQGDGSIFESQSEDEEEDMDLSEEIEASEPSHPPWLFMNQSARKRKQEFNNSEEHMMTRILMEGLDILPLYESEGEQESSSERKHRDRVPMYLQNPDDYPDDSRRQMQIRRAYVTYRHHQDKKRQIEGITEENKKLRSHVEDLKVKILELSNCGCSANKDVDLSVMDVSIPFTPSKVFVRGRPPALSYTPSPPEKCSTAQSTATEKRCNIVSNVIENDTKPIVSSPNIIKPVVNIASPSFRHLANQAKSSNNVVSTVYSLPKRPALSIVRPPQRFLSKVTTATASSPVTNVTRTIICPQANILSVSDTSTFKPAAAPTPPKTASQLLASMKKKSIETSINNYPVTMVSSSASNNITASSLLASQRVATGVTPFRSSKPVASNVMIHTNPNPSPPIRRFVPILPNLRPIASTPQLAVKSSKEELKAMWGTFTETEEDDTAIIEAIEGSTNKVFSTTPPPKHSRKQNMMTTGLLSMNTKTFTVPKKDIISNSQNGKLVSSNGTEIQLDKYADLVFEEAD